MSATNRGCVRNPFDHYPTPLTAFAPLIKYLPNNQPIFECASGDGRLVKAMNDAGLKATGKDLDRDGFDFLKSRTKRKCIVTNPPFSIALEFCDHALKLAPEVFMLLRLNFLASGKRKEWFQKHEPSALFVLSDRPSFAIFCECNSEAVGPFHNEKVRCGHKWSVPSDQGKPRECPLCGGSKIKHTTSDSCDYCWMYFAKRPRFRGIYHL